MKRLLSCLLWIAVLVSPVFGEAEKTILDNGLTVLIEPMPSSEVVSIYAYVRAGSATEGKYLGTGISHFVEHMLFKGTAKRAVGAVAKEVKAYGGNINASTSLDYTMYTLDMPKGKLKEGLDIISDMLFNSSFDPLQVEKERQVIHGEMRLYRDRPERVLSEDVFRNAFIQHPYRLPPIGYGMLFDAISREDLFNYYKTNYIPNNIILSVAGALDQTEAKELVRKYFDGYKPMPFPERNIVPEPPQISKRYFENFYKTPLVRFSFAYQSMAILDPDLYAGDALAMALGQGESCRLYQTLFKNKRLVEQITASNFTPQHKGLLEIEGVTAKDNVDEILEEVRRIIKDIQQNGLTPQELARIKQRMTTQFIFDLQTSSSRAYRSAVDEATTGDPQFSKKYVEAISRVTNDDIKRVAKRILVDSNLSVTVLKPLTYQKSKEQSTQVESSAIKKIVLNNGLTVLLKPDKTVDLVAIHAVAHGGLRQETAELNGISQLFAQVWTKATQKRSPETIIKEKEERGADISGFAGRNSIGISMQVLSLDVHYALELLAEYLQTPAFPKSALEEERTKLLTLIERRDEDVMQSTIKATFAALYTTHPFRFDPLGSKEVVKKITDQDLKAYYQTLIKPESTVISVFGNFDQAQVSSVIERFMGKMPKSKSQLTSYKIEPQPKEHQKNIQTDKEQAVVVFGFKAPPLGDKDRWGMEVIDSVLGSGLNGRLFIKVRDELGKAYTVGSNYWTGVDTGAIGMFVLTTNDKVESVKEIIKKQLEELQNGLINDGELKDVKAYLKGSFKMSLSTNAALGSISALNELYGLGYDQYLKFDQMVEAVSKDDIKRIARQYLNEANAAVVVSFGKQQ